MESVKATAYQHWDGRWRTDTGREGWLAPEPWVLHTIERLRSAGIRRVLDLGCGVGRHTLALARLALQTSAVDRSGAGVGHTRRAAEEAGLSVDVRQADFTAIPYPSATFDYVLAWNVVYHGDGAVLAAVLTEVRRVLRPGGWYQSTMLSKRNREYGRGIAVAADTFVQAEATDDKIHPHLFQDEHDILRGHRGFSIWEMFDGEHDRPGSYHWHVLCQHEERARNPHRA